VRTCPELGEFMTDPIPTARSMYRSFRCAKAANIEK
jgi:hypothetical protein